MRARRRRLLVVSPLPPAWSGIATYTEELLAPLAENWRLTVMVGDGEPVAARLPEDAVVIHASSWRWFAEIESVDRILWSLGNSRFHTHAPALIERHGGVVLAHDVRMNSLKAYEAIARRDLAVLTDAVRARHGDEFLHRLVSDLVGPTMTLPETCHELRRRLDDAGTFLLGATVAGADVVAVHSRAALAVADAELGAGPSRSVVPFGHPARHRVRDPDDDVISSFGSVAAEKGDTLLIRAFALVRAATPNVRLRFVGHVDPPRQSELVALADSLGVRSAVGFCGRVDGDRYGEELSRATIAVQLRTSTNGETSAAIADCLSAGVPTIVSDVGAQHELPDDAVKKVANDIDVIARTIDDLLGDPGERGRLAGRGREFARRNSFEAAANALDGLLLEAPPPRGF